VRRLRRGEKALDLWGGVRRARRRTVAAGRGCADGPRGRRLLYVRAVPEPPRNSRQSTAGAGWTCQRRGRFPRSSNDFSESPSRSDCATGSGGERRRSTRRRLPRLAGSAPPQSSMRPNQARTGCSTLCRSSSSGSTPESLGSSTASRGEWLRRVSSASDKPKVLITSRCTSTVSIDRPHRRRRHNRRDCPQGKPSLLGRDWRRHP
jgi:hypothetical protein